MKLWRYGRPIESLGQRYRLDGILGSGGMADVCLAWDEREEREVAIKILKSDDLDQETLNRFMKEAAQIANWQHPNILRVYESMQIELIDAAQGSVLFYIVTEYAHGGDLHKRLTPGRPFPLAATFALFRPLCGAVQYAHDQGVIHRDLKPLNILFRRPVRGPEEVVLSDFGLAVQVDASHHTFARGGTLAYMAQEQFQGHALPASDIFALGVILYQLCTGYLPFRRTVQDIARMNEEPAPAPTRPSLLNPELPAALDEIILRALQELPTERYHGAQEFWDAIALTLVTAASTFPAEGADEYAVIQTWPIGNSEQFLASPASSDYKQSHTSRDSAASSSHPAEPPPPTGEGPASTLRSVREKQKASPAWMAGSSLPAYSIPAPPNPRDQLDRENAQARAVQAEDARLDDTAGDGPRQTTGAVWGEEGNERAISPRPPTARVSGTVTFARDNTRAPHTRPRAATPPTARANSAATDTRGVFADDAYMSGAPSLTRGASGRTLSRGTGEEEASRSRRRASSIPERASAKRMPAVSPAPRSRGGSTFTRAESANRQAFPKPNGRATASRSHSVLRLARTRQPGGSRLPLVPIITTAALLALIAAILLAAGSQGWLLRLFGAPVTTVTLTPRSQMVQQDLTMIAVTGQPNPASSQVQTRLLTATSPTQSATANASGSIPAKRATGILTLINNGSMPITVHPTVITDNNGVQVSFKDTVIVPATPPSSINVLGFAVNPGAAGNIPVLDIVKSCCTANIVVKNTSAFTGGQDAQPGSVIEQKDIDGAVSGLEATLKQDALNNLRSQVLSSERVIDSTQQCHPQINADRNAADVAKSVTVQVAVTCSEQVYDYSAAQQIALRALQSQVSANRQLGSAYTLDGQVALTLLSANAYCPNDLCGNNLSLTLQARGLWVYSFSQSALRQFSTLIAGKSEADARALLLAQPGVAAVQFQPSGTLPVNTAEIQIELQRLPGAAPAGTP